MAEGSWEVSHVLFAKADNATGALTCQLGDVKTGDITDPEAIIFQSFGLLALPAPPIPGVSAPEGVTLNSSAGNIVVSGRSVRSAAIAALLKQGESTLFADGSQAVAFFKLDGSVNLCTTHDNTSTGRNVNAFVHPSNGFGWEWPWSRLRSAQDGLHYQHVGGAFLDIGQLGLTGPFEALATAIGGTPTYATLSAKLIRIEGTAISLGSAVGVPDFAAKATAILAAFDAIAAVFTRLAAPASIVTPSGPGTADPALVSLITAAQTAITSAHALVPSASVTVT